jgi:hypothetical protein
MMEDSWRWVYCFWDGFLLMVEKGTSMEKEELVLYIIIRLMDAALLSWLFGVLFDFIDEQELGWADGALIKWRNYPTPLQFDRYQPK